MRIYVAGKTHDYPTVRQVQSWCRGYGHEITYDWTQCVEVAGVENEKNPLDVKELSVQGQEDELGVYRANLLIALAHPRMTGTLVEIGMAMAWHKVIWLVGFDQRDSVFWYRPNVERIGMESLPAKISQLYGSYSEPVSNA